MHNKSKHVDAAKLFETLGLFAMFEKYNVWW